MIVRRVWATHRFDSLHAWPDAPRHRSYLASEHRHLFHVRATVDVVHDDREIEFHDLLDAVVDACVQIHCAPLGSCEQIADDIAQRLRPQWPKRRIEVDVSEDGENGATVTHLP